MEAIMESGSIQKDTWICNSNPQWVPENTVEIEQSNLLSLTEKICTQARYPFLTLRLLIHIICTVDTNGQIHISARHLAKKMDVHYDTVTKCLKYLREIEAIKLDK